MYPNFKDYFYFNRSERRGIIALIAIILLLIAAKELLYVYNADFVEQKTDLDSLITQIEWDIHRKDSLEKQKRVEKLANHTDSFHFYDFNPNEFPADKWQDFGLTEKQAAVIKRYEASGGNFRSKKDVKKMFVISDELFGRIKDHILLPDSIIYKTEKGQRNTTDNDGNSISKAKIKIDINTADTSQFKKLYGIGTVLSKRIVDYREKLGGFYSITQLQEVYGLESEVLARLDTQLLITEIKLRMLNINKLSSEELKEHPLIDWKVANAIVKYRKQHGLYESIHDIKKSLLISDTLFDKLRPYIEIE